MGFLVVVRRTQGMKKERTFQRRTKRLIQKERGKAGLTGSKVTKGVWYFPFQVEADELVEEAKSCGLKEVENIMLFEIKEIKFAPKELIKKEMQARKEIEEEVQKFMNSGKEHQK